LTRLNKHCYNIRSQSLLKKKNSSPAIEWRPLAATIKTCGAIGAIALVIVCLITVKDRGGLFTRKYMMSSTRIY